MKTIQLTKVDYTRIKKSINTALHDRRVNKSEADSLLRELDSARLVEPHEIPPDTVTMNSIVRLKFLDRDNEIEFQIVYPKEADSSKNKISIFSPVATALIGYKTGDEIEWVVPAGITKMKIEKIVYQPEAAGDLHL